MEHRSEIVGFKLSKVEDARLGRWTSVGYFFSRLKGVRVLRVPSRSSVDVRNVGL